MKVDVLSPVAICAGCRALEAREAQRDATIAALTARLEVLERPRSTLRPADRLAFGEILPAAVGAKGSKWFVMAELFQTPQGQALTRDGYSRNRVGQLFAKAAKHGLPIDGYVVERAGRENGGVVWRILGVLPEDPSSGDSAAIPFRRRSGPSSKSEEC